MLPVVQTYFSRNQEVELTFCIAGTKAAVCQRNNAHIVSLYLSPSTLHIHCLVFLNCISECFREQFGLKLYMEQINYHLLLHYNGCIITGNSLQQLKLLAGISVGSRVSCLLSSGVLCKKLPFHLADFDKKFYAH